MKLSTKDLGLLEIMRTYTDDPNGFVPSFDKAHPNNKSRLEAMKAACDPDDLFMAIKTLDGDQRR